MPTPHVLDGLGATEVDRGVDDGRVPPNPFDGDLDRDRSGERQRLQRGREAVIGQLTREDAVRHVAQLDARLL